MTDVSAGDELARPAVASSRSRWRLGRRRRGKPPRARWLRYLLRTSLALLVIVLGLAGAEAIFVSIQYHKIHHLTLHHLVKVATSGPHVGAQTFLLIGSTSRCVLNNKQTAAFGSCAEGITGVNSDVIVLVRADQQTHSISILSIPRDLVMNNVRPGQFYKIDAALADGPDQLVAAIEQNFGIPINHFVELNFDSFQNIVNALGGIKMDFPDQAYDTGSSLRITKTGCQLLNGFQALAVVRSRHYFYKQNRKWLYDGNGDLSRIIRVHEFLRALATAVEQRGVTNPLTDNALLSAIAPNLEIDSKLSLGDMVNLLRVFHSTNPATAPELTLPNIENFADYIYNGSDYGSVVLPTYPQDQRAIDQFLGLKVPPGSTVAPGSVTVSVLDASGAPGQATRTASQLSSLGFHVVGTGATTSVGPISETVVYYAPGHLADGERVVKSLSGIVAMAEGPTDAGAEVTVDTGSNFSVFVRHARAHVTTTTTVPLPSTAGPPSAASQPVPSYDPRPCSSA